MPEQQELHCNAEVVDEALHCNIEAAGPQCNAEIAGATL
jgi:hypothetical protein